MQVNACITKLNIKTKKYASCTSKLSVIEG